MAVSADLIALTEPLFYYKFAALALTTSLLTLFTVIPMYVLALSKVAPPRLHAHSHTCRFLIDMIRQGAIFSYVVVEIVWLCKFLCITEVPKLIAY